MRRAPTPVVPVGPPLVQEHDALADTDVQDDEDQDWGYSGGGQGVDLGGEKQYSLQI